ncbi:VWA domain-containing protein [Candidatus Gracilibacteria bacterium]|nr:VWA domain-containing protein [Candidatus Gracilibacteria bacterium]
MDSIKNIVFTSYLFGFLSFIIGVIFLYLYYISNRKNGIKFQFIKDIEKVFGRSKKYFFINIILIFLIIITFSRLVANPMIKNKQTENIKNGIDIAIVLDLSYSMIAEDIKPNRLEVAKEVISNFTSSIKTDRVGLVLFSGTPFTSVPLTFDYEFITNYIKNISIKTINQNYGHLQGTAIGDGLLYGANLFNDNDKREKVIILFTDGEANRGIDPLEAIKYINTKNIKVYTVGIGGNKDTYVNFKTIYGNQKVEVGGIDEENLKAIANLTGGKYYKANTTETFKEIFDKLDLLSKNGIKVKTFEYLTPYYKDFVYMLFYLIGIYVLFNLFYYLRR